MIRALWFLPLLLLAGCIQLGSEPQPTRYYLLEAVASGPLHELRDLLHLEIAPVDSPSYLDRAQIVSRATDGSIRIAEYDRWAEPLPDNLSRSLQENLYRLLPGIQISKAPWGNTQPAQLQLKLQLNHFDGSLGGQSNVDLRWSLHRLPQGELLQYGHFSDQRPVGNSYRELVQGLERSLAELSRQLATALLDNER